MVYVDDIITKYKDWEELKTWFMDERIKRKWKEVGL
jgi:hypothetical protein